MVPYVLWTESALVKYGECFALLGVSGAGKTNCFKCLTGEIYPTQGDVSINGHDVTTGKGFEEARKQIATPSSMPSSMA